MTRPFLKLQLTPLAWLVATSLAQAQIRTDASLGQAAQSLAGPNYQITQSLGKLAGSNLFHSFQTFNLATGESANFSTTSPGIANVISRVTGGGASQINGALRLSAASGAPAFFFINPAGVTFGAGASVDVPGAFHVSTANSVNFADGRFQADLGRASTLSVAPPEAFGFLGSSRATVAVQTGAVLNPKNGFPISVVAGDVLVDGGFVGARAGDIRVIAVGPAPSDIPLGNSVALTDGKVTISKGGIVGSGNTAGKAGGLITLRGGDITIDSTGQVISTSDVAGPGDAGGIDLAAKSSVRLLNGGNVSSFTGSLGNAGGISVQSGQITLDSTGYVYSSALQASTGQGASISLQATNGVTVAGGASVSTDTASIGQAGSIQIRGRTVALQSQGYVASNTFEGSTGDSGAIAIQASDSISLTDRARTYVSTASSGRAGALSLRAGDISLSGEAAIASVAFAGAGSAGTIDVRADRALSLTGNSAILSTSALTSTSGAIRLAATDITLDGSSKVTTAAASGTGNAGAVEVVATGSLLLRNNSLIDSSTFSAGQGGAVKVRAKDITLDSSSAISSIAIAGGTGNSGTIDIESSGNLLLSNGGSIVVSTSTAGNAGSVNIAANSVNVNSGGLISTATLGGLGATGNAGNVVIHASGAVTITDGFFSSSTFSGGRAGTIEVNAKAIAITGSHSRIDALAGVGSSGQTGTVSLRASDSISLSSGALVLTSNGASLSGPARPATTVLTLSAPRITLGGDAWVSSVSTGNLAASDIDILFTDKLLLSSSRITTSANDGNGGRIRIRGGSVVSLSQSKINTSVTGSSGNGGDIQISADAMALNSGFIQANTSASLASGGLVNINLKTLAASGNTAFVGGPTPYLFTPDVFGFNVIQAAAPTGVNGVIQVSSPVLDLSGSLGRLGAPVMDVAQLGRTPCQIAGGSSLAQAGHGGLPVSYRGLLGPQHPSPSVQPGGPRRAPVRVAMLEPGCQ